MKKMMCGVCILFAVVMTGCSYFSSDQFKSDLAAGLSTAYQVGGKQLVYQKIDEQVAEGKITEEQGKQLKEAADKGVETIVERANAVE